MYPCVNDDVSDGSLATFGRCSNRCSNCKTGTLYARKNPVKQPNSLTLVLPAHQWLEHPTRVS